MIGSGFPFASNFILTQQSTATDLVSALPHHHSFSLFKGATSPPYVTLCILTVFFSFPLLLILLVFG